MAGRRQTGLTLWGTQAPNVSARPGGLWNRALLAGVAFGIAMACLSGCAHTSPSATNTQPKQDPLFGMPAPPPLPGQPAAPATTPDAPATGQPQAYNPGVPPIPRDLAVANMATAAGTPWPAPLGQFALDDRNRSAPTQLTSGQKPQQTPVRPPTYIAPNRNPRVEEVPPESKPASQWQAPPGAQAIQTVNSAPPAGSELLYKQLQDHGVVGQKQDVIPEGIRLTCYVARDGGRRVHEAVAPDYATAAQAILREIDPPRSP